MKYNCLTSFIVKIYNINNNTNNDNNNDNYTLK